jgi:hypothetical protein
MCEVNLAWLKIQFVISRNFIFLMMFYCMHARIRCLGVLQLVVWSIGYDTTELNSKNCTSTYKEDRTHTSVEAHMNTRYLNPLKVSQLAKRTL